MTIGAPTVLERIVLPVVRALVRDDETVDEISLRPDGQAHGPVDLLLTITIETQLRATDDRETYWRTVVDEIDRL